MATVSTYASALAKAHRFDYTLRFWVGYSYQELWKEQYEAYGGSYGLDFTQWITPAYVNSKFTEVTAKITSMTISEFTQGQLGRWKVTLQGHGYDAALMRRERTVVCTATMERENPAGGFDIVSNQEGLLFIGMITGFEPLADFNTNAEFKLEISGVSHFMDIKNLDPQSWGKVNLAEGKPCDFQSTLLDPSQLVARGEFVGTQVSLGPENAVDGVLYGPPACSATPPMHDTYTNDLSGRIREVYLWPPAGFGPEYQWFAVRADTLNVVTDSKGWFHSDNNGHPEAPQWYCYYHYSKDKAPAGRALFPSSPCGPADKIGIFCYNRSRVEELFDLSGVEWVVEWGRELPGYFLNPDQGYIAVQSSGLIEPGKFWPDIQQPLRDMVCWSKNDAANYHPGGSSFPGDPVTFVNCSDNWGWLINAWGSGQPAVNVNTIQPGQSIARKYWNGSQWVVGFDNNTTTNWSFNDLPLPGGVPKGLSFQYATLNIGPTVCNLDQNFTPGGYPKTMYLDSAWGLSAKGKVQVSTSIFDYDYRDGSSLHITGGPASGSTIGAGNPVYQYDAVSSTMKKGYRLSHLRLWRKPGLTHIALAELHGSYNTSANRLPDPANPLDETIGGTPPDPWWLDWGKIGDAHWGLQIAPPRSVVDTGLVEINFPFDAANPEKHRYTQLMLRCWHMQGNGRPQGDLLRTADGGYFMLNEWEAFGDEAITSNGETLPNATAAEVFKNILNKRLGLPEYKIIIDPNARQPFKNQVTTKTNHSNVLSELAKSYGLILTEALDGTVYIDRDPWWPGNYGTVPVYYAFTKAELASISEEAGPLHGVAQAKIQARDPEGKFTFTGVYPRTPSAYGEIVGEGTIYIASTQEQADAIANAEYIKADSNVTITATAIAPLLWLRPHMLVTLDWPYDNGLPRWDLWIIKEVQHSANFGTNNIGEGPVKDWTTTFTAQTFNWSGRRRVVMDTLAVNEMLGEPPA